MLKIIIADDLCNLLHQESSFLGRSDVKVFPAVSNDEVLRIARTEHVDLIITQINMPGMDSDQLYSLFRADRNLRSAAVIMVCTNSPGDIEKCARCGASNVILRPVNKQLLLARAQKFLALFTRESYRVSLSVAIDAVCRNQRFSCHSLDIGVTGMKIETEKSLTRGDRIVCSFALPESSRIVAEAEIVDVLQAPRGAGNRYGIRFKKLAADAKQALQAFVDLGSRAAA
jgi:two-component system chemotaxis response regulator CheY